MKFKDQARQITGRQRWRSMSGPLLSKMSRLEVEWGDRWLEQ